MKTFKKMALIAFMMVFFVSVAVNLSMVPTAIAGSTTTGTDENGDPVTEAVTEAPCDQCKVVKKLPLVPDVVLFSCRVKARGACSTTKDGVTLTCANAEKC